jgi:hypothetical protein
MVQTTYGATGKRTDFEPLTTVPQDVRDQVPFIHIGTNRSLAAQLPGARYSLWGRMFEDTNQNSRAASQTVE